MSMTIHCDIVSAEEEIFSGLVEMLVATGDTEIQVGDKLYLLAPTAEIQGIPPLAGYERFHLRRVMIAGGSAEGEFLAQVLEERAGGPDCRHRLRRDRQAPAGCDAHADP